MKKNQILIIFIFFSLIFLCTSANGQTYTCGIEQNYEVHSEVNIRDEDKIIETFGQAWEGKYVYSTYRLSEFIRANVGDIAKIRFTDITEEEDDLTGGTYDGWAIYVDLWDFIASDQDFEQEPNDYSIRKWHPKNPFAYTNVRWLRNTGRVDSWMPIPVDEYLPNIELHADLYAIDNVLYASKLNALFIYTFNNHIGYMSEFRVENAENEVIYKVDGTYVEGETTEVAIVGYDLSILLGTTAITSLFVSYLLIKKRTFSANI